MGPKKQLFIVEDHRLFREGLKAMLSPGPEYEMIGEAEDGLEAIRLIKKQKPDLVLLDLSMPRMNGLSVLREIKGAMPEVKILVLSIHESDQYVLQAFEARSAQCRRPHGVRLRARLDHHQDLRFDRIFEPAGASCEPTRTRFVTLLRTSGPHRSPKQKAASCIE